jgi:hypothetical protein
MFNLNNKKTFGEVIYFEVSFIALGQRIELFFTDTIKDYTANNNEQWHSILF